MLLGRVDGLSVAVTGRYARDERWRVPAAPAVTQGGA